MCAMRSKPLLGGPFGTSGRFAIASVPCIDRGLHAVRFAVLEQDAGRVVAIAKEKTAAIASARSVINAVRPPDGQAVGDPMPVQAMLFTPEQLGPPDNAPPPRHVSRRRREVFERSNGRCHYCGTALTLDGQWHIEHQLPRALNGTDEAVNLVASCVPCNLKKADRTAIEFWQDIHSQG